MTVSKHKDLRVYFLPLVLDFTGTMLSNSQYIAPNLVHLNVGLPVVEGV